jgi:hypothetical protein
MWHGWGSIQVFALARAGKSLGHAEWVDSARREADAFFTRLLAGEMVGEWGVLPFAYPQIAYGVNSITQGLLALHDATGDDKYGRMAGLAAGWFYGNNGARFVMYDPATGRGYDGLQGPSEFRVNRNSGAESTIEALMALQGVATDPVAARYLHYRPQEGTTGSSWQVLEAEAAKQAKGDPVQSYRSARGTGEARWSNEHYITIGPDDAFAHEFNVPVAGKYYLYAAYLRQAAALREFLAEALHAPSPPSIDGDLGDWSTAQLLSATTTANIVRGAAGWGGADKDAFVGYVMWDEQNLYVAARVFDPEHRQDEIGPSVWKGDTLWVYLDSNRDRSTIDLKLTLAQTPEGPQVWNWKGNSFVRDVKLAWKLVEGSYTYEASMPWEALGVSRIEAGKEMGLELGRGCCGSGFQDLSGKDPDTAANLVPMVLVDALSPGASEQAAGPAGPDAVALRWNLNDGGWRKHSQGRGGSDSDPLSLGEVEDRPAGGERVGHRLLGPDVLAGRDRLPVEPLVLLHVGQVDQQVERRPGEHLVDVRVAVGDLELVRPPLGPLGNDVAGADQLDVRALGEVRQVDAGDAATADDADADAPGRLGGGGQPGRERQGRGAYERAAVDVGHITPVSGEGRGVSLRCRSTSRRPAAPAGGRRPSPRPSR